MGTVAQKGRAHTRTQKGCVRNVTEAQEKVAHSQDRGIPDVSYQSGIMAVVAVGVGTTAANVAGQGRGGGEP